MKIYPSLLACDFNYLADEVKRAEDGGADGLHIDIMDGHFVPNLTMGPKIVAAVKRVTKLPLDVHLMIYNPFDYIEKFVESGADSITFHFEATEDVSECLDYIRKSNIKAGLAFCPETSESMIPKYLNQCDLMLLMTVHPGFGGQEFMSEILDKVKFTRDLCNQLNIREGGKVPKENETLAPFKIQVDGGIDEVTGELAAQAGANVFVAGTSLYKADNMKEAITNLRKKVKNGTQ
ncbi:ribulose-phosphate 3-epimerase [Chlamydiales bacterium]|nr:ribulose-phosphate 3-epimerase [Chlamydiales bacterium]